MYYAYVCMHTYVVYVYASMSMNACPVHAYGRKMFPHKVLRQFQDRVFFCIGLHFFSSGKVSNLHAHHFPLPFPAHICLITISK